jgi:hypothetical protein
MIRPNRGANVAYAPEATALHFRASWRDPAHWGPDPLHRWLEIAADDRRWPPALRVTIMSDEPPQASVLRAIEDDPAGWTESMRRGISSATDLLAWTQATELDRFAASMAQTRADAERWQRDAERSQRDAERWQRDAETSAGAAAASSEKAERAAREAVRWQREAEASAREAESAAAQARDVRAELHSLLGSSSWRLTAPMRRAGSQLRRLGPRQGRSS